MVNVTRRSVDFDVKRICGDRFVRTDDVPFDHDFTVYLVRRSGWYSTDVPCSAEEQERWQTAATRYLDALSEAYTELCLAHGVRRLRINLLAQRWSWSPPRKPLRLPGWRRRLADRSRRAQERFLARAAAATAEYEPVRAEIERRVEAVRAEQLARQREAEERQRRHQEEVMRSVARQRVWLYAELPGDGDIVYVYRDDRRPARQIPADAQGPQEPLDARGLEAALQELNDRKSRHIVWDPEACAEVERRCEAEAAPTGFGDWWAFVTDGRWHTHRRWYSHGRRRSRKMLHVTTHHSAHGVGWYTLFATNALFGSAGLIGPAPTDHGGGDYGGTDGGGDYGGGDYGGSYGGSDGGAGGYGGFSFGGSF